MNETNSEQQVGIKLIGLTGGIGSGKTEVAKMIETKGYPVYYSDVRAKEIVNEKAEIKVGIIQLLGEEAYDEKGQYNRKWVAQQVFNNSELLLKLNAIIHPVVKQDFEYWKNTQNTDFIFKETALLFELGLDKSCFKSILVTAENQIRIKRVMDRDGKTYREVEAIIQKQMPEKEKRQRADFVIDNNGSWEDLEKQVEEILSQIVSI